MFVYLFSASQISEKGKAVNAKINPSHEDGNYKQLCILG